MITPESARWARFGLIAGPFITLIAVELIVGRAWLKFSSYRRTDEPFDYWSTIIVQAAVVLMSAWFILLRGPT